ncbi:1-deoxy-D-xylulose-5-phosphate reductoisomerase [Anaerospora sp.]|uniref:1-deoxy-D-xylulose-5-phosphate reductoisomerase n=1 Tax=Anaerospora sp. TaxID=1960278 RepID=UPI00289C2B38|nr:1-deoxy-D-xylulose-5-phosphate reductoisomerase [Anaerospora sp.]
MHHVAILGSTGSIGTQTLDVITHHPELYRVTALAAYHNDVLLEEQIQRFNPLIAVLVDDKAAARLKSRYRGTTRILAGEEGMLEAAAIRETDTVLTAMVGAAGIKPTITAIEAGKNIALANKETLVAAGEIVTQLARKKGVQLLPVDSEHSALMQCLHGEDSKTVKRLLITASGGPFRGYTTEQLGTITVEQCLCHPNWSMGKKITVDSATLVNKGLEVIEAKWLFDIEYDNIDVVVHPQSIIHSMVEFVDGSTIAQLGKPDMRLPIQYALTYPQRITSPAPVMDWTRLISLEFMPPDKKTFRGLDLAYRVGRCGGTLPCVFNAANEIAVHAFLANQLPFLEITTIIEATIDQHQNVLKPSLPAIFAADSWAREYARELVARYERENT